MIHVVPAHLVGAVGEAVRVFVIRRHEQEAGGIRGAGGNNDEARAERLGFSTAIDEDFAHGFARRVGDEFQHLRIGEERDIRVLERGANAEDFGVGLRLHEAGKSIAILATNALAVGPICLVEHDAAGRVEGMVARALQVVGELLDAWLVRDGGMRVGSGAGRLGGILPARAVDMIHLLGLRVVGLEILVAERPGGRDAVVVFQDAEVLFAQAVERGAVELRGAADEVVHAGLEFVPVLVAPEVLRGVAVRDENLGGRPVLGLAGQPAAAFEDEDAFA